MASAFISYSHADQKYVIRLARALESHGLNSRYDRASLRIGDSLIEAISKQIHDDDFLIAIIGGISLLPEGAFPGCDPRGTPRCQP